MNSQNINIKTSSDSDEISLKDLVLKIIELWQYLLSKWLIILLCAFIGGLLGFVNAYFKKPIYTARTTFVLEDEKGGGSMAGLAGLASIAGLDVGGSGGGIFQGDNILGLYKSRNMLEKTLLSAVEINGEKQLLIDRYIENNDLKSKWAERPALLKLEFTADSIRDGFPILKADRLRDSILGVVVVDLDKNYLLVEKPDKKLSTIQVDVKATDELFAKAFNDQLVKNVNEFYINTKTKKTLESVRILQYKTDSVRAAMNGAIYTAVVVTDATPNLNPTRQVQRIAPAQKAQFSAETNKAVLSTLVQNLEMTKMTLLKEMPLIQVIDQPILPLNVEKFGKGKALIIGCILGGLIATIVLTAKRLLKVFVS